MEVVEAVADLAERVPNSSTSARAVSRELGVPWSTVRKILRSILYWYSYKIEIVQQLKPHDPQQSLDFVLQFLARMEVDVMWPENSLWTDEAHFTLEGAVNTQNCRIWGSTKPLIVHQRPLHSVYVTVWFGFTNTFILGPFFFERITPIEPVRCTVTSASYENILMQRVILPLHEHNWVETTVFMQDGAPPHVCRKVQRLLREALIDERIISRSSPNPWPARSPYLNPCDFWLWGYLKDLVYQGYVRSLVDLKTSIQRHVAQIPRDLLRATIDHAILGMQHVVEASDAHIENIL